MTTPTVGSVNMGGSLVLRGAFTETRGRLFDIGPDDRAKEPK